MPKLQTAQTAICRGHENTGGISKCFHTGLLGGIKQVKLLGCLFGVGLQPARNSSKWGAPLVSLQRTTFLNLLFLVFIITGSHQHQWQM